jgi:hypothetical protein
MTKTPATILYFMFLRCDHTLSTAGFFRDHFLHYFLAYFPQPRQDLEIL